MTDQESEVDWCLTRYDYKWEHILKKHDGIMIKTGYKNKTKVIQTNFKYGSLFMYLIKIVSRILFK